jgi:hypothetical protein
MREVAMGNIDHRAAVVADAPGMVDIRQAPMKPRLTTEQRADTLEYIADLTLELKQMAERAGYDRLACHLGLACAEAGEKGRALVGR